MGGVVLSLFFVTMGFVVVKMFIVIINHFYVKEFRRRQVIHRDERSYPILEYIGLFIPLFRPVLVDDDKVPLTEKELVEAEGPSAVSPLDSFGL